MKIKPITQQGHAALVEWTDEAGMVHRSIVRRSALDGNQTDPAELTLGIPADGIELTAVLASPLTIDPAALQNALRRAGVWTKEDYLSKPEIIFGVLQKLYGADVATLQNIAVGVDNGI